MSEQNNGEGRPAPESAAEPVPGGRGDGRLRMLITGILFIAAAVATFIAGDDNRWISIPGAIVAAVALVDFLSVNQRRRRAE